MEEYFYQSRATRIFCYTSGAIFTAVWLILIPSILSTASSIGVPSEPSPEDRDYMARLAEQAKEDTQAAESLRALDEVHRQTASLWHNVRLMAYSFCLPGIGMVVVCLAMIAAPIAAVRRHRRRAKAWHTVRQGSPSYRNGLVMALATLALMVSYCTWLLGLVFLPYPLLRPASILWFCAGLFLVLLASEVATSLWRFHCRDWRIRLAEIPVRPGELVQFEIFRESGKPIDKDLRMELVGWQPKWNTKKDCYKSCWSLLLRTIGGEVHLDGAPGQAPGSIRGTLRFEGTNLVAVPPDGVKHPRRLIPFLRVRKGWWRWCLFDLPAPALYVRPEAGRQSSVDERPNGH